jgi:ribose transport system ATP-binding protein
MLAVTEVSKTFPGQTVLKSVDLAVRYGEVHALVGQNGSGKSTLIKILAGFHQPDPGASATMDGEVFTLGSALAAERAGLRFVHQDLGLVLALSAAENLMLGRPYPVVLGVRIRWDDVYRQAAEALHSLGVDVDVRAPVSSLSLAERTAVAIARALAGNEDRRIIAVLDEPTAALPPNDVNRLLDTVIRLKETGNGVLLVSHHLDEVLKVADRISVLRDGRLVGSAERSLLDHAQVVEMILGRPIDKPERVAHAETDLSKLRLKVQGLSGGRISHLDLEVHAGEVVGFAGITGSGRESLAPLLTGRLARNGRIMVDDRLVRPHRPESALKARLASIPGERAQFGNFPNLNVRKNLTIADLAKNRRFARISQGAERREADEWIARLGIVTNGCEAPIGSLSGGNQQKVLVARALRLKPRLLVLDDPTLGVDVGAKAQIHAIIGSYAADGMGVVVVSTDSEELATLCDIVHVFSRGVITRTLLKDHDLTASAIDQAQLLAPADDPDLPGAVQHRVPAS